MVKKSAMFVVNNHQERFAPLRSGLNCVDNLQDQLLPFSNIAGRMIIVPGKTQVRKIRVDPRNRREIAGGRISQEAFLGGVVDPVKSRLEAESIVSIHKTKRGWALVRVPVPRDSLLIQLPYERGQVV